MTLFREIFFLKKDISKLTNKLGHKHENIQLIIINTYHSCTIFYACPKIFINCTFFAKFVSHFSGRYPTQANNDLTRNFIFTNFIINFCIERTFICHLALLPQFWSKRAEMLQKNSSCKCPSVLLCAGACLLIVCLTRLTQLIKTPISQPLDKIQKSVTFLTLIWGAFMQWVFSNFPHSLCLLLEIILCSILIDWQLLLKLIIQILWTILTLQ